MVRSPLFLGACAVWVGLLAVGWALGGAGDALLTPLPDAWTGPPIVGAFAVGMMVAYGVGAAVPWRLPRRLASIVVLATTVYSVGQAVRGAYALVSFGEEDERQTAKVMITGAADGHVNVMLMGAPGAGLRLPATAEVLAAPTMGRCAEVVVEVNASGAARIAPEAAPLTPADLGACR